MIIITTPMCEKILQYAGIEEYKVNKHPDDEEGDLAILLSESKINMNSLAIKLNTFSQIRESIVMVSKYSPRGHILDEELDDIFKEYNKTYSLNKNVKVSSNFLKDIAMDMGLNISNTDYDYVIYPDYLKNDINKENDKIFIEIPTHSNVSKNPLKRCKLRYELIENFIND